jgi:hypothetical protein
MRASFETARLSLSLVRETDRENLVALNDLPAAIRFWQRLGFARSGGDSNYLAVNVLSSPSIIGQQKMGSLWTRRALVLS